MLRATCLSAALLACAPALAQNYAGTYTATNASGGTVMLTLAQDAQSGVSGTLTGYGRSSLQVQARVEAEGLRGTAGNSFGLLYLTSRLNGRSEEHTSELQSLAYLVCRLLLEKKKKKHKHKHS